MPAVSYPAGLHKRSPKIDSSSRVPRVARLLALAHEIERLIAAGRIPDAAEAARMIGFTRARLTQIRNLLLLAPDIQESILGLQSPPAGRDTITEHSLRRVAAEPIWSRQRRLWRQLISEVPDALSQPENAD